MEYQHEKNSDCDELGERTIDEKFFCRDVVLKDADRDSKHECDKIGKSEKYSHERKIVEQYGKKIHHCKVKKHPDKSLEYVGKIKIAEFVPGETGIYRYIYSIL